MDSFSEAYLMIAKLVRVESRFVIRSQPGPSI